ncbi:MAG: sugar phosphate nucleotidyltransferase [Saprospiraceae bacterium]
MNLIIPMAGRGSRLRPHTLTVPKPLVPVAGKPIVQRLAEDLTASLSEKVENIAFVIGDFGPEVPKQLMKIAEGLGAKGHVFTQDQPLGTAHAILCAQEVLEGPTMIAFADTLFKADFKFDTKTDGIIWAQRVEDPSAFGVLKLDDHGVITDFVEKPVEFVSDLAIVGIYFVNDGTALKKELQYLIDNNITDKGEYQLTNALEALKSKGVKFLPGTVEEWLDCGNKVAVVHTHQRILELKAETEKLVDDTAVIENSVVLQPCFIGAGARIINSVVGPHVSLGANSSIEGSVVRNTIIQNDSTVANATLTDSMIGSNASYTGQAADVSIGDYSNIS